MSAVAVLVADDDPGLRRLVAERIRVDVGPLTLLEAGDGVEAVDIALERRPRLALLDVGMPRLDGIDVAVTLRDRDASLQVALHTSDAAAHRARAAEHGLALFDKLDLEETIEWLREAAAVARGAA
jgi:CheY-like chemotaxis protein